MNSRPLNIVAKVTLVVLATAAGAATGAMLGLAYTTAFMPNAELEGVVPPVVGAFAGAATGTFVALTVLFKVPRVRRERATVWTAVAMGLVVLGLLGWLAGPDAADVSWATLARAALPLGALIATTVLTSRIYGRDLPDVALGRPT